MMNKEMQHLSLICSPHVIALEQTYKTHHSYYIVTELCNGGDLTSLMAAKGGYFSQRVAKKVIS